MRPSLGSDSWQLILVSAVVLFSSIRWLVSRMSEVVPVMRIRDPPPRLPIDPKGKARKKLATKKWKYPDADTARAAAVAAVALCA